MYTRGSKSPRRRIETTILPRDTTLSARCGKTASASSAPRMHDNVSFDQGNQKVRDNNLTVCQHKSEDIPRCHKKLLTTLCACMVFQQRPRRTFSSHNSVRAHAHAHHGSCMAGSSKAKSGTSIMSN